LTNYQETVKCLMCFSSTVLHEYIHVTYAPWMFLHCLVNPYERFKKKYRTELLNNHQYHSQIIHPLYDILGAVGSHTRFSS